MNKVMDLPDAPLRPYRRGAIAKDFLARGVEVLAAQRPPFVHAIPATGAHATDPRTGSCSRRGGARAARSTRSSPLSPASKGSAIGLRVGLYLMCEANTEGVGAALEAHGFVTIPEAHAYLLHDGARVDLTHPGTSGALELEILEEHVIGPEDVGERKLAIHSAFLDKWAGEQRVPFERAWRAREACIAALSSPPRASR